MNRNEIQEIVVFSSGPDWNTMEVRFCRGDLNIIEAMFSGIRGKEGRHLRFRGFQPEPAIVAFELYLGFDDFVITDLTKRDPQREIGRFEMHIFRDDCCFRFAFDTYEIEEADLIQRVTKNDGPAPYFFGSQSIVGK